MLSFIIPAHNEEQHIGRTVESVTASARENGEPFEVIVVDDASTDRTAAIAAELGARVIHVQNRKIAATRNAGAWAARGDVLFFVDADTLANPQAVRACIGEVRRGAVGGGCMFRFDGAVPIWAFVIYSLFRVIFRLRKFVGGCFMFCTRDAFAATGGFCERYYAAEEEAFIRALKQQGRFAIPRPVVVTSGRKLRANSARRIIREVWRLTIAGPEAYQQRESLDLWYGERTPDQVPDLPG